MPTMIALLAVLILGPVLGSFFGAFGGLMVSIFFGSAIQDVFFAVGMTPVALWKVGAALGFFGGFFRSVNSQTPPVKE